MVQPRTAGPAPGYVGNPGHKITLEPSPRRVRVLFNGETVADSTRMKLMHESHHPPVYYFPLEDMRTDLMTRTDHSTHCPYKGDASYWAISVGARSEDNAVAGAPRSLMEMAQQSALNAAKRPAALLKNLAQASSDMIDSLRDKGLDGVKMAPAVSFNGAVSAQRSVAWSSVDLSELKRAKETLGVTVNDVILGITGGAVRRYLDAHDELPEESLRVSVPVSIRAEGDRSMGNQINEVTVDWGTDRADPIPRIRAIHEDN